MRSLLLTILITSGVFAQDASKILDKATETMGNDRYSAINFLTIKAETSMSGMDMKMTMYYDRGGRFRQEINASGISMVQLYDGQKGWQSVNGQSYTMMSENEISALLTTIENLASPTLENMIKNADEIKYQADKSDKEYHCIYVRNDALETVADIYINKANFLPEIIDAQNNGVSVKMELMEFAEITGARNVLSPMITKITSNGQVVSEIIISSIESSDSLPDHLFTRQ